MLISKTCTPPVERCVCRSTTSKTYLIKPGQSKATATWPVPQYSCGTRTRETTMVEPNVKSPHAFPRGDHIIKYTFRFEGGVDVVCPVTIIVKGKMCGENAFDSCKQDCCCGTIHDHMPGFKCCGPKYYNPADYKCCDYAHLVSSQSCPIY
ncbi:Hypothetical predicted protein [Paramuricea clavata]|uniref:Uncharacterized protein n=2 Tax=Paramuricea clavata TaxID=317549 RepID=A0A6S7IYL1_PARCT|nr:Hypothetical predicted protein [Paramuricea clavata]